MTPLKSQTPAERVLPQLILGEGGLKYRTSISRRDAGGLPQQGLRGPLDPAAVPDPQSRASTSWISVAGNHPPVHGLLRLMVRLELAARGAPVSRYGGDAGGISESHVAAALGGKAGEGRSTGQLIRHLPQGSTDSSRPRASSRLPQGRLRAGAGGGCPEAGASCCRLVPQEPMPVMGEMPVPRRPVHQVTREVLSTANA